MTYQSGTTVEYKYNAEGLRVQKSELKVGTDEKVITDYTLHGKLITHLTKGSEKLHFVYDAQSRPSMVQHNGAWYGYVHNLQGDIIAIVDASGTQVVEYKYDAWGRKLSVTGTKASTLGALNPFRYRGYVFDEETYHYYLRSRYYYPAMGRFISADAEETIKSGSGVLQHDLYTYCCNNPVAQIDNNGQWPSWGQVFGAVAAITAAVVVGCAVIAAAPAVAATAMATAACYGFASAGTMVATYVSIGSAAVATGVVLNGANRAVEVLTGTNYVEECVGGTVYENIEAGLNMASAGIIMTPSINGYPSTGRTTPRTIKEQMKFRDVIQNRVPGRVIIASKKFKDPRMPGWLGWQKYSVYGDGVDIHYVGNKYIPALFDYKFKDN